MTIEKKYNIEANYQKIKPFFIIDSTFFLENYDILLEF